MRIEVEVEDLHGFHSAQMEPDANSLAAIVSPTC